MKPPSRTLAYQTWELVFELLIAARPHIPSVAARCGLTEAQGYVLRMLEPGRPVSMGCLADRLDCDASNVTGMIDRLEARGLVERRACGDDRRVRQLLLTPAGVTLRAKLNEGLAEPPEPVTRLSAEEQQALCILLRKALGRAEHG